MFNKGLVGKETLSGSVATAIFRHDNLKDDDIFLIMVPIAGT